MSLARGLPMHGARGFTLLEMLVVLGVMAAGMALVAPSLSGAMERMELVSATREVAGALRFTRARAMGTGQVADFHFDVSARQYRAADDRRARRLSRAIRLQFVTADTQATSDGAGFIRFYPDGTSSGGQIRLLAAGQARQIDVHWLTGAVRTGNGPDS